MRWRCSFRSITILIAFVTGLSAANSLAELKQIKDAALAGSSEVVQKALARMRMLSTGEGYKVLGFSNRNEANDAQLGGPIPVFSIDSKSLLARPKGADPSKLLTECDSVVYPVIVSGKIESAITISKTHDNKWVASEYGSPEVAAALDQAFRSVGGGSESGAGAFIAQIETQNVYLKGKLGAGAIQVKPVVPFEPQGNGKPGTAEWKTLDSRKFSDQQVLSGTKLIDDLADREKALTRGQGVR